VVPTATPEIVRELAERDALEPVPVNVTVCVPTLSVRVRVPFAAPAAVGVKVTLIVQVPLAAMPVPHVLVSAKPVLATMPVKVTEAVPVSVTVTDCEALVTPTPLEKVRALAERLTAGVVVVVVLALEEPPQPAKTIDPTRTAKRRLSLTAEKILVLIAPPPP
jgi:hypothetical protein